jgi:subtilisin family serine protease
MSTRKRRSLFVAIAIVTLLPSMQSAAQRESGTASGRVIVVFRSGELPADADTRVLRAGGTVIARLNEVGILVAAPSEQARANFVARLRADSVILAADDDELIEFPRPAAVGTEPFSVEPDTHSPHPAPFVALPADYFYTSTSQQWAVKRVGAQGGGIAGGGAGAWDVTRGAGTRIAILDTGVNVVHPDIAPNLVFNAALTSDDPDFFGTPNCEVRDPANPPFDLPVDQLGHGSFTSSLAAAAAGPGTGLLVGVAPQAQILNIKILRNRPATAAELKMLGVPDTPFNRCLFRTGSGLVSWVLQGMLLANAQGADVISMSLGAGVPRNAQGGGGAAVWAAFNRVINFVTSNGSVIVAAAGNNATDLDRAKSVVAVPADSPGAIAVTATTNPDLLPPTPPERQPCEAGNDCLAYYSNYGTSLHGVAAPGGDFPAGGCTAAGACVPTGFLRGACSAGVPGTTTPSSIGYPASGPPPAGTSWGCFNGATQHAWYVQVIGTSASTPLAGGVAALIKSVNPNLSPSQVTRILLQTAEDIGKISYDELFGFGLVNATAAVAAAQ